MMETLNLDTLYRINRVSGDAVLEVIGGDVDVYGSFKEDATAPENMFLTYSRFNGISKLGTIPSYLYVGTSNGVPDVKLYGCNAEVVS